jgi:drug/metabolite transporter (DMT)-like permease
MKTSKSLHGLGVACGLAAGVWLGAAEAPTKLVTVGYSPFLISLGMVGGVFVARWTVPIVLKSSEYVLRDFRDKLHLIVWAILAGMCWAVANTLTVFAIRNVGLSVAFPLWNTNCLVGLFWGWLLFGELRGSKPGDWAKVLGGSAAIVTGACLVAYATSAAHRQAAASNRAAMGILAALGAGALWGSMYIPYKKAYISGMNPLSFVTVFTVGELATTFGMALMFDGGVHGVLVELGRARPAMFWLFLGGFCWVLGDIFQQYAAKYIGIGRGIPLSNTNQLWGLAWGALVFGELAGQGATVKLLVIVGSVVMIAGAIVISFAAVPEAEKVSWKKAMERECTRYGLNPERTSAILRGEDPVSNEMRPGRRWWEVAALVAAVGLFLRLGLGAEGQAIAVSIPWMLALSAIILVFLIVCGRMLWKLTGFS